MTTSNTNETATSSFCQNCGRPTAAKRPQCLYCGAEASIVPADKDPLTNDVPAERAESDEPGWSVIADSFPADGTAGRTLTSLLQIDPEKLPRILDAEPPLPIARLRSSAAAQRVCSALTDKGFGAHAVDDRDLFLDRPPRRVAAIELSTDGIAFVDFNTRERFFHTNDTIRIAVEGRLFKSRVDTSLKRTGKTGRETIDERIESDDVGVIDIYTVDAPLGYRIRSVGFDFSCLGGERSYIAAENLIRLADLVTARTGCQFDRRYLRVRSSFDIAWPLEKERGPGGLRRANLGALQFDRTEIVSNEMQFLRYSRWANHIL